MMKLTLHIGTEKTGTTSLQVWLAENRSALRERGVVYPTSLGQFAHRDLAIYAMNADNPDDGFRQRNLSSPDAHRAFRASLRDDFAREYDANAGASHWLISSEHLHSRLPTVESVERVRQFFADRFEAIEILVHLRPQIDVAVSLASTAARVGLRIGPRWFSERAPTDPYFNYDDLVRRWEDVFGDGAVTLIPFKRRPHLADLLIDRLNIEVTAMTPMKRMNEALDWRAIALINAIVANNANADIASLFPGDWPNRERLQIGLDTAKRFQDVFDSSNAALIARRRDLAADDLTPDWAHYDASQNLSQLETADLFGEQLGYLATRLTSELALERCARQLAECELALARGATEDARAQALGARGLIGSFPETDATSGRLEQLRRRLAGLLQQTEKPSDIPT
jgi:hypothetical protein